MKVVEIFESIEGEGKRTGELATFVRLFGCNLRCTYCDTRYGCEGTGYTRVRTEEVVEMCKVYGHKNVTVTGGEPLIHPGIGKLLKLLVEAGFDVNVETNGSRFPLRLFKRSNCGSVFYTADYKCPTSGMESYMDDRIVKGLTKEDVLKFVVGNFEDLERVKDILEYVGTEAQVYISPVFGAIEPKAIVAYALANHLDKYNVRVQVQLHKVVWSPEERGV